MESLAQNIDELPLLPEVKSDLLKLIEEHGESSEQVFAKLNSILEELVRSMKIISAAHEAQDRIDNRFAEYAQEVAKSLDERIYKIAEAASSNAKQANIDAARNAIDAA